MEPLVGTIYSHKFAGSAGTTSSACTSPSGDTVTYYPSIFRTSCISTWEILHDGYQKSNNSDSTVPFELPGPMPILQDVFRAGKIEPRTMTAASETSVFAGTMNHTIDDGERSSVVKEWQHDGTLLRELECGEPVAAVTSTATVLIVVTATRVIQFSIETLEKLHEFPIENGQEVDAVCVIPSTSDIAMIAVSLPGYSVAKLLKYSWSGDLLFANAATPIYRDYEAPPNCEAMCQAVPFRDHFICVYDHCSKKLYFFTVSTGELVDSVGHTFSVPYPHNPQYQMTKRAFGNTVVMPASVASIHGNQILMLGHPNCVLFS